MFDIVTLTNSTVDDTAEMIFPLASKLVSVVLTIPTIDYVLADRNMSLLII